MLVVRIFRFIRDNQATNPTRNVRVFFMFQFNLKWGATLQLVMCYCLSKATGNNVAAGYVLLPRACERL